MMHEILADVREWLSSGFRPHHSEEAGDRYAVLQLKMMEVIIMQLSELSGKKQEMLDTLSKLEADVGALVQRAGQSTGSAPSASGGLSANDQAAIDGIGDALSSVTQRMETLRTQVVGVDNSGQKVDAPPVDKPSDPVIVTEPSSAPPTPPTSTSLSSSPASTPPSQ